MNFLLVFFVFVFGTIVGSFLNVVILRYNTGKNIFALDGRSMCFSCGKTLQWYELVPVLSFLVQNGKCRSCKSKISWQYPLVEIITGFIFLGIIMMDFPSVLLSLFHLTIWSLLIVISVYDLRHKIIPDGLVFGFIGLSFCAALFSPALAGGSFLNSLLAGVIFFGFFAGLWLVSGGRWLGFGDAKLVLGVGFLLGFARGLSALTLAFWIGAAVSIVLLVVQRSGLRFGRRVITMKSEIPFAPFIILGTLIAFFCHVDIFGIGSFL